MANGRHTRGLILLILLVLVLPGSCQLNASVSRKFLQWKMFAPVEQIHHHDKYSVLCVTPHGNGHGSDNGVLHLMNCAGSQLQVYDSMPGGFFGFILPSHNETGPIRTGSNPDLCWTPVPTVELNRKLRVTLDYCTGGTEQNFIASYREEDLGESVILTWQPEMLNVHVGPETWHPSYALWISSRTHHWFTLRSEGLSWGSPFLAPALLLGSIMLSSMLLFLYVARSAYIWIASGLRIDALVKTFRKATLFMSFGRCAIDQESEAIHKLSVHFRIQHAQAAAHWTLHLLVMPAAALLLFRKYSGGIEWGSAISAQHELQDNYLLEGTLIMACLQFVVVFRTLVTEKFLDCINVLFSFFCVVSTLIRGPSASNNLDPFLVMLSFRIFYTIFCGNARLTLLLQIAISFVELTGVDFVPYGSWVSPQAEDLPLALSMLTVVVSLACLIERQTLREARSVHQATVEKQIRERLLAVMVDGDLSVKRDEGGIFRISALSSSASQLLGVAPDCSIVGETLECLTSSSEDLEAVVTEAEEVLEGPALLREIRLTTQYGQHFATKSYVVGTPSGVTIALLVSDEIGSAVDSAMYMPVPTPCPQSDMLNGVPDKIYSSHQSSASGTMWQTIDRAECMVPKARSSPAGDSSEFQGSRKDYILNGSDVISDKDDDAVTFMSPVAISHRGGQITGPTDRAKNSKFPIRLSLAIGRLEQFEPSTSKSDADLSTSKSDADLSSSKSDADLSSDTVHLCDEISL